MDFFQILHPISKQTYKLKLPKKYKIYNVFYILRLEQNITKKRQVNNMQLKFEDGNNEKYKVNDILNSVVNANKSITEQLLRLYYRVLCKNYFEEKNI